MPGLVKPFLLLKLVSVKGNRVAILGIRWEELLPGWGQQKEFGFLGSGYDPLSGRRAFQ